LSNAQIARPDVSVSSVRVSDTVSTNTRARGGAEALWSSLLTNLILAVPRFQRVPRFQETTGWMLR